MVAEAVQETELNTQTPPPDATQVQVPADVTPPSQEQEEERLDAPVDAASYLKSEDDGGTAKPEARRRSILDDPRLAQNRQTLRERTQQLQSQIAASEQELVSLGVLPETAKRIVDGHKELLNKNNSDWAQLGHSEAAMAAVNAVNDNIATGMQQGLEAAVYKPVKEWLDGEWAESRNPAWEDVFGKIVAAAREKHISIKDAEKAIEKAVLAERARVERILKAASSKPLGLNGTTSNNNGRFSDLPSLARAFNNEEIDRDTYSKEHERLTGRKP